MMQLMESTDITNGINFFYTNIIYTFGERNKNHSGFEEFDRPEQYLEYGPGRNYIFNIVCTALIIITSIQIKYFYTSNVSSSKALTFFCLEQIDLAYYDFRFH